MSETKPQTKADEIQARRDKRKADLAVLEVEQSAIDLEAIDALEVEHGDNNIAVIVVPFTQGSVTRVAVRTPHPDEIKRYRFRVKPKKMGDMPNTQEGASELAEVCRVYPPRRNADGTDNAAGNAAWSRVLAERPGLDTQLGLKAVTLAVGSEEESGKD